MKNKPVVLSLVIICLAAMIFSACTKDNNNKLSSPTITSISSKSDTAGAQILITGTNFSTTASQNIVKFGTVAATVVTATTTQLKVIVPAGATSGPITVTVNGESAGSTDSFTPLGATLVSFFPTITGIGYPVVLTGTNFSADISMMTATINDVPAAITAASATQVTIVVPDNGTTGKIKITVKGQDLISVTDLKIMKLVVTTLAGNGTLGYIDGPAAVAGFSGAWSIAPDPLGNYFVADANNRRIRKVTADGTVTTFAGFGPNQFPIVNGSRDTSTFAAPYGVIFDKSDNLFVTDLFANEIRKISPNGIVSTLAGNLIVPPSSVDGTGSGAGFISPLGIAVDGNDNLFVVDSYGQKIRKVTQAGVVTTIAGNGSMGTTDGNGTAASFKNPYAIAIDANNNMYVTDGDGRTIRKITPAGDVTTIAGSGAAGSADGQGTAASFDSPAGIAIGPDGNIYVSDRTNGKIRMITPSGMVTTLAGNGSAPSVDGTGIHARFYNPLGLAFDPNGALMVMDNLSGKVRKIVFQ